MKTWIPALVAAAAACQPALDTSRTVDAYASFGDAIYREACQRVAYTGQLAQLAAGTIAHVDVSGSLGRAVCVADEPVPASAPPELAAIVPERAGLTAMVDAILPQPFLATFETFLERLLPLYDDGTIEQAITRLADLLATLDADPDVPPALARIGRRHGYRPTALGPGLMHAVVEYPDLDGFTGSFLGLIGPGGTAQTEWHALLSAGSLAARTAAPEPDPVAPDRTLRLALDLMLSSHAELVGGTPRPMVLRDARGLAKVALDATGAPLAPFVDLDRDGLADADGDGRFVDAQGVPLAVPAPFPEPGIADTAPRDALGRALAASGTPLYQYLDLDGTLLSGALREAPTLLDPGKDTALGLAWGAVGLLGPRTPQTRSYVDPQGAPAGMLTYSGFDTTQSAVLDLLHGFVQLLGAPDADATLQSAATLLAQFESPASRAVGAMLDTSDRAKQHAEAQVVATSTLYDDLMPLVARMLRVGPVVPGQPTLVDDLVTALGDPHVRGLAPMIARLMTATNQLDFDHAAGPDYPLTGNLDTIVPVDRTRPDVDQTLAGVDQYNRSLMQRITHLVHDANGLKFCNKEGATALGRTFKRCALFEIDDLALFFALNMASDAVRMDVTRRATTYSKASFREQLTDATMKTLVLDSPIGDVTLTGLIKITGFTRFPTPRALSRALFLRPDELARAGSLLATSSDPIAAYPRDPADPSSPCPNGCATDADKDRFIDVHDKSVFAWELTLPGNPSGTDSDTFFDAVRPVIDAFARHDECLAFDASNQCTRSQNAVKIFLDLMAMLHEHWGSPRSSDFGRAYQAADRSQPRFAALDNVVSYEPLLAEVLGASDLVPSLIAMAPVLHGLTVDGSAGGPRALPILAGALRYVFDPQVAPAGLAYRSGATSTVESDGHTAVPRATPYYLLADAFAAKRARLTALSATPDGAEQASKWKAATSALVDQVLTVDRVGDTWQFRNRRFHGITQLLIGYLRSRIRAHAAAGDLDAWVHHDLTSDITDKLTGPVFAALGDLVGKIEHDDAARAQLLGLLTYLADEPGHALAFQTALTTLADQAQQFLADRDVVPLVRALGKAADPATSIVDAEIALVKRSHDLDTDNALLTVLGNLFRPDATGVHPASTLADVVSEIDRGTPGHGGDLDAADEHSLLGGLRGFLTDTARGFLRFVAIVRDRRAP